jgi:hypothetical protein
MVRKVHEVREVRDLPLSLFPRVYALHSQEGSVSVCECNEKSRTSRTSRTSTLAGIGRALREAFPLPEAPSSAPFEALLALIDLLDRVPGQGTA